MAWTKRRTWENGIIRKLWFEPFVVTQVLEGSVPLLVILRATKDLGPAQSDHACPERNRRGSARCFALLSMTILLNVSPSRSFLSSLDAKWTLSGFIWSEWKSCRARTLHSVWSSLWGRFILEANSSKILVVNEIQLARASQQILIGIRRWTHGKAKKKYRLKTKKNTS